MTRRIDAITDIGDRAVECHPIPKSVKIELTARSVTGTPCDGCVAGS